MVNEYKLRDDLTKFFINYLQATERPAVNLEEFNNQEKNGLDRFRSDPVFHYKVSALTADILCIVEAAH